MSNSELAAAAWNAVRRPDDAPWEVLPIGIKAKLADLAGKYRGGARVAEGDYPPEGFAEKVAELTARIGVIEDEDAGEGISFINSDVLTRPVATAEHEDVRIPSPTTEDVDPLKSALTPEPETK